jgi:diguanylate cyclase (GGDEF)-like protein
MDRLRRWISAMSWRKDPADCGSAPSRVATLWDSGIYASILLGVFSVAVAWLGAWYISSEELKRTEAAAYQDTANLARAFEEHIIRLIQAHDQILIFARTSYSKDPQHFNLAQWSREQQFATDVTLQLATTDKRGMLTGSNLGMPSTRTDLSDREHFRVHADSDRDELFISKPVLGRVSGKWSIQLSRRLNAPDGSFDGVVILSIDPYYLASFYDSIDINTQGTVILVGLDGIVRARVSGEGRTVGQTMVGSTLFRYLAESPSGSYQTVGRTDVVRLSSYRRVKGYPLVVVVGLSRAQVLERVEHHRILYFAAAAFVSILVLSFKFMVVRRQLGLQRARDKLWQLANFDSLTGLPNRNRLHEVVKTIISETSTNAEPFALLLLDLDNFKFVNDTLGHEAGDLVLCTAAERIKRMSRGAHLVARLGGDEFAILLRNTADRKRISVITRRVLRALRQRMDYRGHTIESYGSIGIACFPEHGASWGEVFRAADLALYRAKHVGRNRALVFDPGMLSAAEDRFGTLRMVRNAIESDRIVPFYQPEIAIETGEILGFEALGRIEHADGRIGTAAEFLPALEDPEIGRAFGLRMIERVTADLGRWLEAGLDIKKIAVNVSNLELRAEDYHERLLAKLQNAGIGCDRLEIEVTETSAFDESAAAINRNLRALAASGLSIALDDFGTGFASLTHLKSLPISCVKIDRSFVANIMADAQSRSIVDAVSRLSHSLGKSVVAEGVEDAQQLAAVRELGCDVAQGYLFSKPMSAEDVPVFLLRHAAQRPEWHKGGELASTSTLKRAS